MKSLLLPILAFAAASLTSHGAIVITEVMSSSGHPSGTSNDDWFEVTNTGASAVDITGWSWDDNGFTSGAATFGSLTSIPAGQSVIITEETIGAEAGFISSWGISGITVVNLGSGVFQGLGAGVAGDSVAIYNNLGVEVTRVTFGQATTGRTFEWDQNGNSLGTSIAGENGAFVAANNGAGGTGTAVGSPGVSVIPEPSAALLSGIAALGLALRRRRN